MYNQLSEEDVNVGVSAPELLPRSRAGVCVISRRLAHSRLPACRFVNSRASNCRTALTKRRGEWNDQDIIKVLRAWRAPMPDVTPRDTKNPIFPYQAVAARTDPPGPAGDSGGGCVL
jgi:hypothetical protein